MPTLSDLLKSGPGHDGYAYQADTYCIDCGRSLIRELCPADRGFTELECNDSECCPQPIFFGESDFPQHCAACHVYLYGGSSND